MKKICIPICIFLSIHLNLSRVLAVSATGTVSMKVITALTIESKVALTFPSASPGDGPVKIGPDEAMSAKFQVNGEPNTAFQITLPTDVEMIVDGGGTDKKVIRVNTFESLPASIGTLDGQGSQVLSIGATRLALHSAQVPGEYFGSYTVSVVY